MSRKRSRPQQPAKQGAASQQSHAHSEIRDWLLKGAVGGILGVLVTLGVDQTDTIRQRQRLARLLLVEAEQNDASLAEFLVLAKPGRLIPLKEDRSRYEATLADHGVLPLDVVQLLYRTYSASAAVIDRVRMRQSLDAVIQGMGRIEDDQAASGHDQAPSENESPTNDGLSSELPLDLSILPSRVAKSLEEARDQAKSPELQAFYQRFATGPIDDAKKMDWKPLISRLRQEATARWWMNWLE